MIQPEIIIVPAFFATIAYVAWVFVTASQRKQRTKLLTDFHGKLLDKLGSVKDFSEFLHTPAGSRFMQDLAAEPLAAAAGPRERILRAGQIGAVLICLGIGLLLLGFTAPLSPGGGQEGFAAVGAIALSLGVGFAASAVTSFRVARVLGLLKATPDTRALDRVSEA